MASGGEEGRGKLRKGAGICQQEMIRTYPNGATRVSEAHALRKKSKRRELKHLNTCRRRKKIDFPSSGERKGKSLNRDCYGNSGVVGVTPVIIHNKAEPVWKVRPQRVIVPYA